jgi:hypothetical protein
MRLDGECDREAPWAATLGGGRTRTQAGWPWEGDGRGKS